MDKIKFTPLESQVMDWLLAGEDPVLNVLRQQFLTIRIKSREYTGVGFYLQFDALPKRKCKIVPLDVKPSFCFGDIDVVITTGYHQKRVGFVLWVKHGCLDQLEAYTYGNDEWPLTIDDFQISYIGIERNLSELRRNWEIVLS